MQQPHAEQLMASLAEFYAAGTLTDVSLSCEGKVFLAHKVVLVAFSSVFESLLSSSNSQPTNTCLVMQTIKDHQMECVLNFMYSGSVQCNDEDAGEMLTVAESLGMRQLQEQLMQRIVQRPPTQEVESKEAGTADQPIDVCMDLVTEQEKIEAKPSSSLKLNHADLHLGLYPVTAASSKSESSDRGMHSCDECDFKTRHYTSLRRHKMRHEGYFPYQCEFCDYASNDATSLKKHKRRHYGQTTTPKKDVKFTCDTCGLTLATKSALKRHMWKHTGFMPYSCDICDLKFSNRECFIEHRFAHDNKMAYGCHQCDFECRQRHVLKAHLLSEHKIRKHLIEPRSHLIGLESMKNKRYIRINRQTDVAASHQVTNNEDLKHVLLIQESEILASDFT